MISFFIIIIKFIFTWKIF